MTARLPIPGQDDGTWGAILNGFLGVAHNSDGSLTPAAVTAAGAYSKPVGGIPQTDLSGSVQTALSAAGTAVQKVNSVTPDGTGNVTLNAGNVGAMTQSQADARYLLSGTTPVPTVYVQPSQPTGTNTGDLWIPTAPLVASDIGAEASAHKNQANGYMGLDGSGIGQAPPQYHGFTHAQGQADDLYLFGGNASQTAIENMPYFIVQNNIAPQSGTLYLSGFSAWKTATISQISVCIALLPGTPGQTLTRVALVTVNADGSLTSVAETAADTTIATQGSYQVVTRSLSTARGLPSTYQVTRGTRYAFAILQVATSPTPMYGFSGNPIGGNPLIAGTRRMSFQVTAQSDIALSYTSGQVTNALGTYYWGAVS